MSLELRASDRKSDSIERRTLFMGVVDSKTNIKNTNFII